MRSWSDVACIAVAKGGNTTLSRCATALLQTTAYTVVSLLAFCYEYSLVLFSNSAPSAASSASAVCFTAVSNAALAACCCWLAQAPSSMSRHAMTHLPYASNTSSEEHDGHSQGSSLSRKPKGTALLVYRSSGTT
jgi:hypothetical protein